MEFQNGGGEFFACEFAINVPRVKGFCFGRHGKAFKANGATAIIDCFFTALGAFRATVGLQAVQLAAHYDIDVEGDLAAVLPRLEGDDE